MKHAPFGPMDEKICWDWGGNVSASGYGIVRVRGITLPAHQIALMLDGREIPPGCMALHHCDNRRCVRASHLYVGTAAQNARDREVRNRSQDRRGAANGHAKLSAADVMTIRRRWAAGDRQNAMAAEYGVARATIWAVIHGQNWWHLPAAPS